MARPGSFTGVVVTVAELNALGAVYTSGTRPTGADVYEGLHIWETDTNRWLMYDGTNWIIMAEPSQSYTPTLTNLTLGNGTLAFTYHRSDGWCDVVGRFTYGSTSAVSGVPGFSLPVTASGTSSVAITGATLLNDSGTGSNIGALAFGTTGRVDVYATGASGTYVNLVAPSSTVPHTWATGDSIDLGFRYRMANRYT